MGAHNTTNQGIVHISQRDGGEPYCKHRSWIFSMTAARAMQEPETVCKRCLAKHEKKLAIAAKYEARQQAQA